MLKTSPVFVSQALLKDQIKKHMSTLPVLLNGNCKSSLDDTPRLDWLSESVGRNLKSENYRQGSVIDV